MRVTVPTMGEEGLKDQVAEHIGMAPTYTIVNSETGDVRVIENTSKPMGGQGLPPEVIANAGTDVVLCNFLLPHVLKLLDQFGIEAYVGASGTVEDALKAWEEGRLSEPNEDNMGPEDACPGA